MSFNCDKLSPNLANVCTNDSIGSGDTINYQLPNFCTGLVGFDSVRENFCEQIGGGDEWEYDSTVYNNCFLLFTDAFDGISLREYGCCDFACATVGAGTSCKRKAYNGNNFECCKRDYEYNKLETYCFQDNSLTSTCNPNYRNITNNACAGELIPYCAGSDLNLSDNNDLNRLNDRWTKVTNGALPDCVYYMNRSLFTNANTPGLLNGNPVNPNLLNNRDGFVNARETMKTLINNYVTAGYQLGAIPGFPAYDQLGFQSNVIFPICSSVPGLCSDTLSTICGATNTNELISQPSLVPWCGCYMSNIEYSQYVNDFQINKECTPICARQGNIQLADISGYNVLNCQQSVCIIDDVTISLENTQIGGDINFSQFCSACTNQSTGTTTSNNQNNTVTSTCECIINGLNIDAASSAIGGDINLSELCGSSTLCYRPNPDGGSNLIQVPCNAGPNYNPNTDPAVIAKRKAEKEARDRLIFIIFLIILIIAILIIILYILGYRY